MVQICCFTQYHRNHIFTKYKQRKSYQYDINSRIYFVHKTVHFILDKLNYACGVLTIGCTNILTS